MAVRLIRKGSFTSASSRLQSLHASLSTQQALKNGLKDNSRTLIKISFQIAKDVPLILSLPQNLEIQFTPRYKRDHAKRRPEITRCRTLVLTCIIFLGGEPYELYANARAQTSPTAKSPTLFNKL